MKKPLKIVITTGDVDGIGLEITAKALIKIGPKVGANFFLWRAPQASKKYLRRLDSYFKRQTVLTWPEALKVSLDSPKVLVDINSNRPPGSWVEESAKAGLYGHVDAIATAPLSKTSIVAGGQKDLGHTEILKRIAKSNPLYMSFVGDQFSVVLATGHLAVEEIAGQLSSERLEAAIRHSMTLRQWLPKKQASKPIALVGLNPHAGESGLIGNEEQKYFLPLIEKLKKEKLPVDGPLVPDVAFQKQNWKKYSIYVSPYHDQGLIPFKMIHGLAGVHITMGLPFVRTSVDHGTAKDIFGKDRANPESMIQALKWAIDLAKLKADETKAKEKHENES
ncbi:MAG: PdxA family protein [Bdellovibrionales bacterium]